jgi:uncharacterized protein (DUF924 family)
MMSMAPETVMEFWLDEVGPEKWYTSSDALDAEIRRRFGDLWEVARQGGLEHWRCSAPRTLAYVILTDQMPRNMFRGTAQAFATDRHARSATKQALNMGWDLQTPEPQRQFFYLALEHSECANDQERAVRLILTRMPQSDGSTLLHARAHREVIRRFGRFPFRNAALGRTSSAAEQAFLDAGGYGPIVRELAA